MSNANETTVRPEVIGFCGKSCGGDLHPLVADGTWAAEKCLKCNGSWWFQAARDLGEIATAEAAEKKRRTPSPDLDGQIATLKDHLRIADAIIASYRKAARMLTGCAEGTEDTEVLAALAMTRPAMLGALREAGWVVAIHNDYRLNGEARTFWLFTKGSQDGGMRAIKGEGATDEEALAECVLKSGDLPGLTGAILRGRAAGAEVERTGEAEALLRANRKLADWSRQRRETRTI